MQKIKTYWERFFQNSAPPNSWWQRKQALFQKRKAQIVHIKGQGKVYRIFMTNYMYTYEYFLHISFLIKERNKRFAIEEVIIPYNIIKQPENSIVHEQIKNDIFDIKNEPAGKKSHLLLSNQFYSQLAAVRYAERWWSGFNPIFSHWQHNSLSFVFQCIYAGFQQTFINEQPVSFVITENNMTTSLKQLAVREVASAHKLRLGDIILYDFAGNGHWKNAAIVTAKDSENEPLVNTHFPSSRHRFWSFEDSMEWTPDTEYKFLQIH